MKHCRLVALCAPILAVVFSAPAFACADKAKLVGQLAEEMPDASVTFAAGDDAARVSDGIQATVAQIVPPGGDFILIDIRHDLVYVVRFEQGCATHHGRFPADLVRSWLDASPGSDQR